MNEENKIKLPDDLQEVVEEFHTEELQNELNRMISLPNKFLSKTSDNEGDENGVPEDLLEIINEYEKERLQIHLNEMVCHMDSSSFVQEDWQLSQFWYDAETCDKLARIATNLVFSDGKIALISCPSLYKSIKGISSKTQVKVFEFDERFSMWGNDFVFYDYKSEINIPPNWKHSFDLVILDPPFLSDDCLSRCIVTAKYLAKDKIILCTGTVMEESVKKFLGGIRTTFKPKHGSNLQNDFSCFINFSENEFNSSVEK